MLKKLINGAMFGAGFAVAAMGVLSVLQWAGLIAPAYTNFSVPTRVETMTVESYEPAQGAVVLYPNTRQEPAEATLAKLIDNAEIVAIARYEPAQENHVKAVITEVLKRDPASRLRYAVGDQVGRPIYLEEGLRLGDGVVAFFSMTSASSKNRRQLTFTNAHIHALGDLSLDRFREMCAVSGH